MITHLRIQNIALIENIEIEFHAGLNIISGETGAGKSMVIDSLNFILGARPPKDFIRTGCDSASVEAIICISGENMPLLAEYGADDSDGSLMLTRVINAAGKSSCKVNGKTVTSGVLREIASRLFDMHSQHEHHALLTPSMHINILDKLCGDGINALKESLRDHVAAYNDLSDKIDALTGDASEREQRIDMYNFQIKEIEATHLTRDEEELLTARIRVLSNTFKINELTNAVLDELYDGEPSAIDKLANGKDFLEQLAGLDGECAAFAEALDTAFIQLDDMIHDFRRYAEHFSHDPNELSKLENRLETINRLKRKYGRTIGDILSHCEHTKQKLDQILHIDESVQKYSAEKSAYEGKIYDLCDKLSAVRRAEGKRAGERIEECLRELGMQDALFTVEVGKKTHFTADGYDSVEFLISPNPGEELKPLAQIASGGEISRVMLALKTVLAGAESIETFVFDEIDAGVSGRTAQKVAQKLAALAKDRQIICITHLPQIASMADAHYYIEKTSDDGKTTANIELLDDEKIVTELARLIGGAKITDVTLKAAAEMKRLAKG